MKTSKQLIAEGYKNAAHSTLLDDIYYPQKYDTISNLSSKVLDAYDRSAAADLRRHPPFNHIRTSTQSATWISDLQEHNLGRLTRRELMERMPPP